MKEKFGEDFMTAAAGADEATEADETIADKYEEEEEEAEEEEASKPGQTYWIPARNKGEIPSLKT